jgi:hypothetical protein
MNRKDVYELIDDERDYQDSLGSDRTDGRIHSVSEELVLLEVYLHSAFACWANYPGDDYALEQIIKVAALSVRCLENNYDKKTSEEKT